MQLPKYGNTVYEVMNMLQSLYFEVKNLQNKHDYKEMKKGLDTLYGVYQFQ